MFRKIRFNELANMRYSARTLVREGYSNPDAEPTTK